MKPMLATRGSLPAPSQDAQWAYEIKWDGMRTLATIRGHRLTLRSRNEGDITVSFPELGMLVDHVNADLILDGEIVALGTDGQPTFGRLQKRMHVGRADAAGRLAETDPVIFMIFDVLEVGGVSTMSSPYTERRATLEALQLEGPAWQTPPHFVGGGEQALETSQRLGLEGIMAKRLSSKYLPGRRSPDWLKIKNVRSQEVVIGGWQPGAGRRAGTFGSLLLGIPEQSGLTYVGKVGTGFDDESLSYLQSRLRGAKRLTSPFGGEISRTDCAGAQWVTPKIVGEVVFTEWTADGRLRHPVWKGTREDKKPAEVTRES